MKLKMLLITGLFSLISSVYAETPTNQVAAPTETKAQEKPEPTVFERRIRRDAPKVYKQLFNALENDGYFVVFETNIGKNLSRFAQRWGDDYNRNNLDSIRSMIFCNGWYANKVSNADPKMLALCPMHLTVTHKGGITSILYVRPSQVAKNSPAKKVAEEIEQEVVRIINSIPHKD